ncbi:sigma-E processing peptidase SpoIIGA [Candidatus Contubernalis alkaliaceticus]|uniref:sigma-E processing peptidase SpoIIGA n=1 Tax=Candidatus Contubernalis alkaliaceticus TaxID=338645 RepID=UPI001F4C1786|nr:sigma-E processing peptidase SpoIIGA [Candidatus Contubernalis alkalaceticus]UNC92869.1 sigma-E processing peptidase SpoIIGA [Candidatus Contubernalis alkalaceticus]
MYLDEVIVVNLAMNYLILWLTARLLHREYVSNRLLLGALLGAIYILTVFLPAKDIYFTLCSKFILSLAIIFAAFYPMKWQDLLSLLGMFYLVSFTVGGAVLACSLFLAVPVQNADGVFIFPSFTGLNLVFPIFLVLVLGRWGMGYMEKKKWQRLFHVDLVIRLMDREVKVEAMLDTGNKLKEPISREPVVVVQYKALRELLPQELKEYFDCVDSLYPDLVSEVLTTSPLAARICFIPYTSLGREKGFLIGFRPHDLSLWDKDREVEVAQKAVIAVYLQAFSPKAQYQALIPPDIVGNVI